MVHEIIEHCMGGLGSPDVVCVAAFELSLRALGLSLSYLFISCEC